MEIKDEGSVTSSSYHLRVAPEIEALQTEIRNHPQLISRMRLEDAAGKVTTFEDGLALIAEYVDVVLHGMYGGDEIADLAKMLTNKLIAKRSPLS